MIYLIDFFYTLLGRKILRPYYALTTPLLYNLTYGRNMLRPYIHSYSKSKPYTPL